MNALIVLAGLVLSTSCFAQNDDENFLGTSPISYPDTDRFDHLSGGNYVAKTERKDPDHRKPIVISYSSAQFLENRELQGLQTKNPDCYARVRDAFLVQIMQDPNLWIETFGPKVPSVFFLFKGADAQLLVNNQGFFGGSISPIDQLIAACKSEQ